ncbi:MAG: hypothetical protein HY814_03635, partial [Candidatus Riflebacteria bacterium]|nr:hypothetical protein [Candidatus Riflebacteria bacterium]
MATPTISILGGTVGGVTVTGVMMSDAGDADAKTWAYGTTLEAGDATGSRTVTIAGTDPAGNANNAATNATFTIDGGAPSHATLSIETIQTRLVYVTRGQTGILVTMSVRNVGDTTADVDLAATGLTFNGSAENYTVATAGPASIPGQSVTTYTFSVAVGVAAPLGPAVIDGRTRATDRLVPAQVTTDSTATTTDSWIVRGPLELPLSQVLDLSTPGSLDGFGSRVYVACPGAADRFWILNSATGAVVTSMACPDCSGSDVSPDGAYVYVAAHVGSWLRKVRLSDFQEMWTEPLASNAQVPRVSGDGSLIYAPARYTNLYAYNPDKARLYTTDLQREPSHVRFVPGQNRAYVDYRLLSEQGEGLKVIDTTTHGVVGTMLFGYSWSDLAFEVAEDGSVAYAAYAPSDELVRIDTGSHSIVQRTTLPANVNGAGLALTPDAARAFVSTAGGVLVVDALSGAVCSTLPVTGTPQQCLYHDGRLWVSVPAQNKLYVFGTPAAADTTAPTVLALDFSQADRLYRAESFMVTATFSEPMAATPTLTITGGGAGANVRTEVGFWGWGTTWVYTTTLVPGDDGLFTITVSGTDAAGNTVTDAAPGQNTFTVDATAPTATLVFDQADLVYAAEPLFVTATFSEGMAATPTLAVAGETGGVNDVSATPMVWTADPAVWTFSRTLVAGHNGLFTVTLSATDPAGNALLIQPAERTFTVTGTANRAPIADAGPDRSVTVGSAVALTPTGTDPDGDPLTYAWTIASSQPDGPCQPTPVSSWPQVYFPYLKTDGQAIYDLIGESGVAPDGIDIFSGGPQPGPGPRPSCYVSFGRTHAFFRVRMKVDSTEAGAASGGFIEYCFIVYVGSNGTTVGSVGINGKNGLNNPDYVFVNDFTSVTNLSDASTYQGARCTSDGADGYFVDWQVPLNCLFAYLPLSRSSPLQFFFATSTAASEQTINKYAMMPIPGNTAVY